MKLITALTITLITALAAEDMSRFPKRKFDPANGTEPPLVSVAPITQGEALSYNGELIDNNVKAKGRLKVGEQETIFTTDAAILVSRDVSGAAIQGAHGFRDESSVNFDGWGLTGYAGIDLVPNITCAGNANHIRGVQARPICNVAGKCDALTGVNVETIVGDGAGHNVYGVKINDVSVTDASVSLQYGLHIEELLGANTNISIGVYGVNAISQFSGRLELIGNQESFGTTQGSLRVTGGAGITGNIRMGGNMRSTGFIATDDEIRVGGMTDAHKVLGEQKTGWQTPTSPAVSRLAIDPATVDLETLAETVNALLRDLHAATAGHGIIGE